MITLTLTNSRGAALVFPSDETKYQLVSVTGLDPVKATLNLANIVGVDGSRFISSKLTNRNIVVLLQINGDAEQNRRGLYARYQPQEKIRIGIVAGSRSVYIDGYVESIACNVFQNGMKAQLSIVCPDPYFKATSLTPATDDGQQGTIDFTCTNAGEVPAYFEATVGMQSTVTNIKLQNGLGKLEFDGVFTDGGELFVDMEAKIARLTTYNNEVINLIPYMTADSEFFKVPVGSSHLTLTIAPSVPWQGGLAVRALYGGI